MARRPCTLLMPALFALAALACQNLHAKTTSHAASKAPEESVKRQAAMKNLARQLQELQREVFTKSVHSVPHSHVSSEQESYFADYSRAWNDKVARVGNLHLPEKTLTNRPHGNPIVSTCINKDGSLHSAYVIKSSGTKALDDAALEAIHFAAPFPSLTSLAGNVDEICIQRMFLYGHAH